MSNGRSPPQAGQSAMTYLQYLMQDRSPARHRRHDHQRSLDHFESFVTTTTTTARQVSFENRTLIATK